MDSKRDSNTSAVGCVEEAGSRSCVVQQRNNLLISIYYMREREREVVGIVTWLYKSLISLFV
jgi:hypothetical protein